MKQFNTTAVCIPSKHYMVDLTQRVREISVMVDEGKYFSINRARQYGKTTTITALKNYLSDTYTVLSLDFQQISDSGFSTEEKFVQEFCRLVLKRKAELNIPENICFKLEAWRDTQTPNTRLSTLFDHLYLWCGESDKKVVLIIDEVDSATNNQVFLDFLSQLRYGYISRDTNGDPAFHSVILAGVTDVKHLKGKLREDKDSRENSPWNIAADFSVDMSLPSEGICKMLCEYKADHAIEFDTAYISKLIYDYTSGYPYLVSRICELIDDEVVKKFGNPQSAWSMRGVDEAVKLILSENNTLFQSLTKVLNNYPELRQSIRRILMEGARFSFNAQQDSLLQLQMYGLIRNDHNTVRVSNRIFETMLYNLFLSDEEIKNNAFSKDAGVNRNIFVQDDRLNMPLIMEHFIKTYTQIYGPLKDRFKEKDGRELFLLYIKPIINGTGSYYIEAQTRDDRRTDVIIDYLGQQYIIELKIWHGDRYNLDGEKQICEYLDYWNLDTGYMLSFNFNKKKKTGVERVQIGNKVLFEGMV